MKQFLTRDMRTGMRRLRQPASTLVIVFILVGIFFFQLPSIAFAVGNLFFGEVPSLYNVTFAKGLFFVASYPLLGNKPPHYAHYQLSRTYFIQGNLEASIYEAKQELALYPENKRTYYILGLTYGYMNMEEQAIDALSNFIEAKPASWAARNDKAWLEFRIGRIDDAIATIEPVSNQTQNPWVQNTYGVLLMNKGRYGEAKKAFTYAQSAAASMSETQWGRAYPGNDTRIYSLGLQSMRESIQQNLALLETKNSN